MYRLILSTCDGPGGHPTLFWEVATGLSGVVGKKGAGDGGLYTKIYSYLFPWGFFQINPETGLYNKQTYIYKHTDGRTQSATDLRQN